MGVGLLWEVVVGGRNEFPASYSYAQRKCYFTSIRSIVEVIVAWDVPPCLSGILLVPNFPMLSSPLILTFLPSHILVQSFDSVNLI